MKPKLKRIPSLLEADPAACPHVSIDEFAVSHPTGDHAASEKHAADLFLAQACALGDPAALAAFECRFGPQIRSFIIPVSRDPVFLDEACQVVRYKLFVGDAAKIAEYTGRGALGAWLRMVALRTALNLKRDLKPPKDAVEVPVSGSDPELDCIRAQHRDEFACAFREALGTLDLEDRGLLKLHHLDGLTIDQLTALYSVPRSTLGRRIAQIREQIRERTRQLLAHRFSLSTSSVDSFLRGGQSWFDESLSRFLK
jgi:RNA polymerase sigma-70 factor (ECF subfamily)